MDIQHIITDNVTIDGDLKINKKISSTSINTGYVPSIDISNNSFILLNNLGISRGYGVLIKRGNVYKKLYALWVGIKKQENLNQ